MSCPIGPKIPASSDLTYNTYLKVPELLTLQKPVSDPVHHDEMLFIVIHQAYELWFKLILHELEHAAYFMRNNQVLRAHHFVKRVVEIQKVLVRQIHILETMTPAEFLQFREKLNPASGFQSSQFREIEFIAGIRDERYLKFYEHEPQAKLKLEARLKEESLWSIFCDLLSVQGFEIPPPGVVRESEEGRAKILEALTEIYQKPESEHPLYLLCESLVDFDQYLIHWREHHVRVVERVIGFKRGTGGSSGVEYLESTTVKKAFPSLWEVRTCLKA